MYDKNNKNLIICDIRIILLRIWIVLVTFLAAIDIDASMETQSRTYSCFSLPEAPVIDGKLDDKEWKHLPMSGQFQCLGGGKATCQTEIRLGLYDNTIFIAALCMEPSFTSCNGKMPIWLTNSIEIAFFPSPGKGLYRYIIDAAGI